MGIGFWHKEIGWSYPMADESPKVLTDKGKRIVNHGGRDGLSDDDMLILEMTSRAPGMSQHEMALCFVNLRLAYGEEALRAIRTGHDLCTVV